MKNKIIEVTAAIIFKDNKILIAQRPEGDKLSGMWEFPGGKTEPKESKEECLRRELFEELGIKSEIVEFFAESTYEYPHLKINLLAFKALIISGEPRPIVHSCITWVGLDELRDYDFCPADIPIVDKLIRSILV